MPHAHGGLVDEDCHRGMHTAYSGIQVPALEPSRIKYGSLYRDENRKGDIGTYTHIPSESGIF